MTLCEHFSYIFPELIKSLWCSFTCPPVDLTRLIDQFTYNLPNKLELYFLFGVNLFHKSLVIDLQFDEELRLPFVLLICWVEMHTLLLVQLVEAMDQPFGGADSDELD